MSLVLRGKPTWRPPAQTPWNYWHHRFLTRKRPAFLSAPFGNIRVLQPPIGNVVVYGNETAHTIPSGKTTTNAQQKFFNIGGFGGLKRFSLTVGIFSEDSTTASVFWRTALSLNALGDADPIDLAPNFWTSITIGSGTAFTAFTYTTDDENNVFATTGTTFSALGVLTAPYLGIGFNNTGGNEMVAKVIMFHGELR